MRKRTNNNNACVRVFRMQYKTGKKKTKKVRDSDNNQYIYKYTGKPEN